MATPLSSKMQHIVQNRSSIWPQFTTDRSALLISFALSIWSTVPSDSIGVLNSVFHQLCKWQATDRDWSTFCKLVVFL